MSRNKIEIDPISTRVKEIANNRKLIRDYEEEINRTLVKITHGEVGYSDSIRLHNEAKEKRAKVKRIENKIIEIQQEIEHIKRYGKT